MLFVKTKGESVLSDESLGIESKEKVKETERVYRHNGFRITKMRNPTKLLGKRYTEIVAKPRNGWYASQLTNFIFNKKFQHNSFAAMNKILPRRFNSSMWLFGDDKLPAIRVPRDLGKDAHRILYAKNFWYNTYTRRWYKRLREK